MNSLKLDGKVAVVTGASKGIGTAIAKHLAAEGAAVVVNYSSSKRDADKVVAAITGSGGKAIAAQADIARKADIERLFAEMKKAFGALDILVNNAGIYENAPLGQITEEHFHRHFNLNVLGLILANPGSAQALPAGGRQHCQHKFSGQHSLAGWHGCLQCDQVGGGQPHPHLCEGTRPAQNPRQLDQSRAG